MYLGTIYISTEFRADWTSNFKYGRQAAILENQQSAITPELMAGSSPVKFFKKYQNINC
jgi:hypothetical protein